MSKGGEKIKNMVESIDNFIDTVKHKLMTQGMGPTITYTGKSLAALLSYKQTHQSGKKTGRIIKGTEDKLITFLKYLNEKNALLQREIKQDIEEKIIDCTIEKTSELDYVLQLIHTAFTEIEDEDGTKKLQLNVDLKRTDARICWYLEKFNDLGISFEDEETLSRNLCMLCGLDPHMEPWIQEKLTVLITKIPA